MSACHTALRSETVGTGFDYTALRSETVGTGFDYTTLRSETVGTGFDYTALRSETVGAGFDSDSFIYIYISLLESDRGQQATKDSSFKFHAKVRVHTTPRFLPLATPSPTPGSSTLTPPSLPPLQPQPFDPVVASLSLLQVLMSSQIASRQGLAETPSIGLRHPLPLQESARKRCSEFGS